MMRGRPCTLIIDDADGLRTIEAVIQDVYSEENAEYVRLDDGRRVRLDRIQRLDDVARPSAC
jgi:transketolase C-terminal domain/subunit